MNGLVLEGGTMRPIFSSGVMDALLSENIMLPYCIGVSAGIADGVSYVSRQKGRNLEIVQKYRNDKRYMGKRNFAKCKSLFGLDFVFDEIPNELIPFDWETFYNYHGTCLVGVTNASTGAPEFLNGKDMDNCCTMLRATCAMPLFFPAIRVGDNHYYDGGLSAPIPIEKALEDGCEKLLVVLTQPKGYTKRLGKYDKAGARMFSQKYPAISETILSRPERYNALVKRCEKLEKEGKIMIIRPNYPLNSFENNVAKLEASYWHGYRMTKERMRKIRKFLGESQP